jgi:hypothetical protein
MLPGVTGDKEDTVPITIFQRFIVVDIVFGKFVVERGAP